MIFRSASGATGSYKNLLDLGISTGSTFDVGATPHLQLDEAAFRAALQNDRADVASVFSNTGKTGIADQIFSYMDGITTTTGFLYDRAKANGGIDRQIKNINDQISHLQGTVSQKETRLRNGFLQMEQMASNFKSQGSALSSLGVMY